MKPLMENNAMMRRLGDYIRQVDVRNKDLAVTTLLGLSVNKVFIPSIANTIGTDMKPYKIVRNRQFVYIHDTSRRGDKIAIALLDEWESAIVSAIYTVFEITDENVILPEYLMLWFRRPEFDRYARFKSNGSAREVFDWEEMCDVEIPVPPIEEQRAVVARHKAIEHKIDVNRRLIAALEETARTIYRHTFVDNIDPENLPQGWKMGKLEDVCLINMGQSPEGENLNEDADGIIFYQGSTDFGIRYPSIRVYTNNPKKFAKGGDVLLSVRAPVGEINIANRDCSIGRGIASIRSIISAPSFTFYLMNSLYPEMSKSNDEGSVFGSINKETLYNLPILIAPKEIISGFENMVNPIDVQIHKLCNELFLMQEIQSRIIFNNSLSAL